MRYFSIPADFKLGTVDMLGHLNKQNEKNKVIEVYGQAVQEVYPNFSGRMTEVIPNITLRDLQEYIRALQAYNIDFNYTMNPSCTANAEFTKEGAKGIIELISRLFDIGVRSMTISSPSILELAKSLSLEMKFKASAICYVQSIEKGLFYERSGCQRIVLDPDCNRNFPLIRALCQRLQCDLEIILNNVCLINCAYKAFHYNHDAHCISNHQSYELNDYFINRCALQKAQNPVNYLQQNWIRPEDLGYYDACGISHYKIQGRQNILNADIIKVLDCYYKESYDGNLYELLMLFSPYNHFHPYLDNKMLDGYLERFFTGKTCGHKDCISCGYCTAYAARCMDIEQVQRLNYKAALYYSQTDQFSQFVAKKRRGSSNET